jgi:DNA repair exonuclease SbcCD ATPase subunit
LDGKPRGANPPWPQGSRLHRVDPFKPKKKRMKATVIILGIACVGLAGTLVYQRTQSQERLNATLAELSTATNHLVETKARLADQEKLAGFLQARLDTNTTELAAVSNDLVRVNTQLASAQTELKGAQADIKTAQADAQTKGARITQLEAEKDEMTKKLGELAGQINSLDSQITETKRKLAAAEGDRSYLTKELARLQTDKAELLRQFNDLAVLRAQVALLRDEAAVNQRIAWTSQGVYATAGRKGAEALLSKTAPGVKPEPSLDVEVEKNGGVQIVPKSAKPQNP